jgi:hypothetical protein
MIGAGILSGMAVTARNFVGSYFEKDRLTTVQYPVERSPLLENSRNFPFLVYDTNDAAARRRRDGDSRERRHRDGRGGSLMKSRAVGCPSIILT